MGLIYVFCLQTPAEKVKAKMKLQLSETGLSHTPTTNLGVFPKIHHQLNAIVIVPDFMLWVPCWSSADEQTISLADNAPFACLVWLSVVKDTAKGMTGEWERFDFDKDAPLDDEAKLDYFGGSFSVCCFPYAFELTLKPCLLQQQTSLSWILSWVRDYRIVLVGNQSWAAISLCLVLHGICAMTVLLVEYIF